MRDDYDRFARLLEEKSEELSSRTQRRPHPLDEIPRSEILVQEVKANWFGSQSWADTLLYGGSRSDADSFLELSFEEAWSRVKRGHIGDLTRPPKTDLLLDLELRLSQQRDHLRQLKEFKASIHKTDDGSGLKDGIQDRTKSKGLVFKDHQVLTVGSVSKAVRQPTEARILLKEHQAILSSLEESLAEVKGEKVGKVQSQSRYDRPEIKGSRKESIRNPEALSRIPDEERYSLSPSPNITITTPDRESRPPTPDLDMRKADSRPTSGLDDYTTAAVPDSAELSSSKTDIPDPQNSPGSEADLLPLPQAQFEPRPSSLLERTRQSMSLLPPQITTRSRQSSAFRRPPRHSQQFPINQFQTPPKPRTVPPSRSGASTPHDELFSENADYASVFKSRPRVATSPLFSPAIHVGLDADGNEYDEDGESVLDLAVDGSPLAGARMR
jgi:hypothetical protein